MDFYVLLDVMATTRVAVTGLGESYVEHVFTPF